MKKNPLKIAGKPNTPAKTLKTLMQNQEFKEKKYMKDLNEFAKESASICGGIYDIYASDLTSRIDYYIKDFSEKEKLKVIELAKKNFDYLTREKIREAKAYNFEHGLCEHGLHPDCCPLGCGDIL